MGKTGRRIREVKRAAFVLNGARAVMASRREPAKSLDFFPTPPWATRTLTEIVLPEFGINHLGRAADMACGEGHMAEVLRERAELVRASDVFDYGYGLVCDFFNVTSARGFDWLITNPPFGMIGTRFVTHMLELARAAGCAGVASFHQLRWIETNGRFELFKQFPPTVHAQFTERVNITRGRWDPDGTTATAYCWIVWIAGEKPRPVFRIPPGQRIALERPDDRARFTVHPVIKKAA